MHQSTWLTATAAIVGLLFAGTSANAAVKTSTQHGNALRPYNVAKYTTVNNRNMSVKRTAFTGTGSTVSRTKGKRVTFKTDLLLPSHYNSRLWTNPQSLVMTPSGNTLYVLTTNHQDQGFITRYNLAGLKRLGITAQTAPRLASATSGDRAIAKNVQVGPMFACGHGQSLARNPKNGQLWFVGATAIHSNVQRVSPQTLKPVKRINFTLKSTVPMGENLIFDKRGHAYFYTYSNGGWAPKGCVKLYQGTLTNQSVKFHLIMQGLRHNPGTKSQSLTYNAKRNRLYFVSDSSIASIPVSKLGHLKASDVEATNFNGHREFEGLQFTRNGTGYLLTNRPAQVMKTTNRHY
ncbi:hypothetical protein [Levilactobacillus spicheri]